MSERSDPLVTGLSALAPSVDMEASRDLFERSRSAQSGVRTRWLLPAAVVTLLIAGLVGVWAIARDDDSSTLPVSPADETAGYQVLLVAQSRSGFEGESGTIDVATDNDSFAAVLEPVAASGDLAVDFGRSIVAVFTIAGNACPPEIGGFDVDGTTWTPRFVYDAGPCDDVGLTWAYVVAFDRDGLGSSISFTLPADTLDGFTGGLDEPGPDHWETIAVEETSLPFGTILAATDAVEAGGFWTTIRGTDGAFAPFVDFERRFVVAFTLPDDACPDRLVRLRSAGDATQERIIWEPRFEPPPGGCEQPLITRTYVVAIDRPLVDVDITFRLPGDEVFGYEASELIVTVERALITVQLGDWGEGPAAPSEPDMIATDVVFPLPPVGEPRLHADLRLGIVWVVDHGDGTVSVLDAVVPEIQDEDEGGVAGLGHLVRPTEAGDAFAGRYIWDAHGRTTNGPRSADLVGFAGNVVDGEVQVFLSTSDRIDGEPDQIDAGVVAVPDLSNLPLVTLEQLPTLSFGGPIWRRLDATLVVEGGVGRLCEVDDSLPVPDLATCGGTALATAVTSTNPNITSWFFGPVLAEFDEFGEIVTVAPLGGRASRNRSEELPSGEGWRLITADGRPGESTKQPTIAVDEASLAVLETAYAVDGLDADLDESVVIAIPVFGNSCPPLLREVEIGDGAIDARFGRSPATSCDDEGINYGFVIAVDRSASSDPVTVTWTDATGRPTDGLTSYDLGTGAVLAGGLVFPEFEPAVIDCSDEPDGLDAVLTVESAVDRAATVLLRAADGTELGAFPAALRAGVNEVQLALQPAIRSRLDCDAVITSDAPPARADRPFVVSASDITWELLRCRG